MSFHSVDSIAKPFLFDLTTENSITVLTMLVRGFLAGGCGVPSDCCDFSG